MNPRNPYTDAPPPHPNLILGSIQLLYWLFFRPRAWNNHLKRLNPAFDSYTSLIQFLRQSNRQTWRFLLQAFLILPILANLCLGLVLLASGQPLAVVALRVAYGVAYGVAFGVALGVAGGVAVSVAFGMAFGMAFGVAFGVAFGMAFGMAFGVAFGVAVGVTFSVAFGVPGGVAFRAAVGVPGGVTVGVTVGVALGMAFGVAVGVAVGVAEFLGLTIHIWRIWVMYPWLRVWHFCLYRLEQIRANSKASLLPYHAAFWDEWQSLPLAGLDEHLLLVLERHPAEGKAALDYLSTSRQSWAAQAVQIELDARKLEDCADASAIAEAYRYLAVSELTSPDEFTESRQRRESSIQNLSPPAPHPPLAPPSPPFGRGGGRGGIQNPK